ncbi:restriction endonuclease subunit S [Treponema vincentii]|uniref:restriction endonuclease subunit S n=2 Tax=Treponema vincentii TaxID=69710 RepID=UPI003D92D855
MSKKSKLENICDLIDEKIVLNEIIKHNLIKMNYISTENMLPDKNGIIPSKSIPSIGKGGKYKRNDTLLSNIRPYFKKIWLAKDEGACSNDVLIFRAKENYHHDFLYYNLANDAFFEYAMKTSKGTKMPRGDKTAIKKYDIYDFDYITQQKLTKTLRLLDDEIELKRQINANLEQQAQAIFKSWFIDFEPFGGTMPDDWQKACLLDIADYTNGLAMQKYRPTSHEQGIFVMKIKELRQGFCDSSSELCSNTVNPFYLIHNGDVIFSWSGSLLVDFWCGGLCGLNQHLFKVTSNKYAKWFYYCWTKVHLHHFITEAADKATTMGHIKRENLAKAEVVIPTKQVYLTVGDLLGQIYNLMIANRIEINTLSALRDALLPKLMSGEIDVSKIEID